MVAIFHRSWKLTLNGQSFFERDRHGNLEYLPHIWGGGDIHVAALKVTQICARLAMNKLLKMEGVTISKYSVFVGNPFGQYDGAGLAGKVILQCDMTCM